MQTLDLKLWRELRQLKSQTAAICLVMACGIATTVMAMSTLASLSDTQSRYYEQYRFAQVFCHLKRAPETLADRIAQIPGVAAVQTRIVVDVTLDIQGLAEPAVGRLISVSADAPLMLNALHLRDGRQVQAGRPEEVLASEAFTSAHGLRPTDRITAIVNGHWQPLRIVGIAISPEYIFPIRPGEFLPDDKRFGVFWMHRAELAAAFDMQGAFNDVALSLTPGTSEADVIQQLDQLTDRYGGTGAYGRGDQLSYKFVNNEMSQLRGMATLPPIVFLSVSSFLLHVVVSRLIGTQREQIATLKAFGFTQYEISIHFYKLVMVLVAAGGTLGTLGGVWFGQQLTALYTGFFRFPEFTFHLDAGGTILAILATGVASVLAVMHSVRRAASLPPAEAMRPEPPARYRQTWLERWGLGRRLSPQMRMVIRNLERQPIKSILSSFGIALALAILILGNCGQDSIDYVLNFQFERVQRQDMNVTLVEASSGSTAQDLRQLPGVRWVEAYRVLPVRLRFAHRSRRLGVMGLVADRRLYRLLDVEERDIGLPEDGLLISEKLAEVLGCRVGDAVTVEVLEGERPVRQVLITGLIRDFTDLAAYMDAHSLHRMMREGASVSGAFLAVDSRHQTELYTALKRLPRVAGVSIKRLALESFRKTLAENLLRMKFFNLLFAGIIAFGVVYNSARVSLSERARELATLRVIGFTRGEISLVLLGELTVLTLLAIPLGLMLGYGLAALLMMAIDTELQRFPLIVSSQSYAFATLFTVLAAILSGLVVRRRLHELDLVAVLKSREQ